jgi:hypothetical protein
MDTLLNGINPYQDVAGMVHDYEKQQATEAARLHDPDDMSGVPYEALEPNREAVGYVKAGRLDPLTGAEIPPTSKTRAVQKNQFGTISREYLLGYDRIKWS